MLLKKGYVKVKMADWPPYRLSGAPTRLIRDRRTFKTKSSAIGGSVEVGFKYYMKITIAQSLQTELLHCFYFFMS